MKRSTELAPLSREHHVGLAIALKLRRVSEENAGAVREEFLEFWEDEGARHFRKEEEDLLPRAVGFIDLRSPTVVKVAVDHAEIRRLVQEIRSDGRGVPTLNELGERLRQHVRLEEEELFPDIERFLPKDVLAELGSALADPRDSRRSG